MSTLETTENTRADHGNLAERFKKWAEMPVGKRMRTIRNIRKSQGLTLKQLSEASGLSIPYLSELERGLRKDPKLSTLEKVAKGLGEGAGFRAEFMIIGDNVTYYPVSVV